MQFKFVTLTTQNALEKLKESEIFRLITRLFESFFLSIICLFKKKKTIKCLQMSSLKINKIFNPFLYVFKPKTLGH